MGVAVSERRVHERASDDWIKTAKASLRPGCPISIVNISRGGALVESTQPMRPGSRVMLQIVTSSSEFGLSAVVMRCGVGALSIDAGVIYRGALRFDERRDWTREANTRVG
jgi:PilZ domain-containing protein